MIGSPSSHSYIFFAVLAANKLDFKFTIEDIKTKLMSTIETKKEVRIYSRKIKRKQPKRSLYQHR